MKIEIPWQCQQILDCFAAHHLQAYLVGGCVRDSLLGKSPKDWDICTEALPEQVQALFRREKVILTGLQHGTVTVLLGGMPVEITTYRIDGAYEDNRHPKEVFFTNSLQADLSRRDFTINALAYHPREGVIDYFHGLEDLEQGIIRCVGDAASRYQEDGLRIMRAIRFACVLNFRFEQETEQAIRQYSYLLRNIARERIQVEFNKILTSSWAAYGLEALARLDCFPYFLPEICHTWQFAQEGGQHQFDIFTHTKKAVALVPPTMVLRLTMLLHDIGKPFVWQREGQRDIFPGHSLAGAQLAESILERLRYDKKTIAQVRDLIAQHERLLTADDVCLRQAIADLGEEGLRNLIAVKRADVWAHSDAMAQLDLQAFDQMEARLEQIQRRGDCCSLKQLAVSGQDMLALGCRGRQIGELLQQLLQQVLLEPARNDRAYLLQQAEKLLAGAE